MNEIRTGAARFALAWEASPGDERQDAQTFVRDLLAVYGVTASKAALYEYRAKRFSTGGGGYIDALIPGIAIVEMKSAGKNLVDAETQALDYLDDLDDVQLPRYVITSDFRRIRLLDRIEDVVHEWALSDMASNSDRLGFFAGYGSRVFGSAEQEAASIKAAKIMASLYEELEGSGYNDHSASVFLVRTLFALFADDSGMFERDSFTEFLLTRTASDGSDLGAQLTMLYQVLATSSEGRQRNLDELVARFPYVNGGVFDEPLIIPSFTAAMRKKLLEACDFNWSAISPAVFGSLFQAVKSKEARRELGEHYTTETNILKLIGPMFLDELGDRVTAGWNETRKLERVRADMGLMRFLDPACGCGNFLVVGYRELRALDLRILLRLQELNPSKYQQTMWFMGEDLPVKLSHFHGIELEEWPARIAAMAMHLVEHQANLAMVEALGDGPEALPLDKVQHIVVGNAILTDWTTVVGQTSHLYVMGNPPFLGHKERNEEQTADLRLAWNTDSIGLLDYVTAWYAKAIALFALPGFAGQFAFVSTNSIALGDSVPALFSPVFAEGWSIKFAHRTFRWTSEASGKAQVHCVIVGFQKGTPSSRPRLFDYEHGSQMSFESHPRQINAYLVEGPNVLVTPRRKPLSPSLPQISAGSTPIDWGHLTVEKADYPDVFADKIAVKYLRPYYGGEELINKLDRWCLWLVDAEPSDIVNSRVLRTRVEAVRAARSAPTVKRLASRELAATPQLFGERRQPTSEYLGIPQAFARIRTYATAARLGPEVIASIKLFTAADSDGFLFAIISSSAYMAWQRAVGQRTPNNQYSFTASIVWNNLPIPAVSDAQRLGIIAGGEAVLKARALHADRSLADLYNPLAMDPPLLKAHARLDRAVDLVLGMRNNPTEAGRLAALFASYERMSAADQLTTPKAIKRRGASTRIPDSGGE
ncbi:class I SAM-dependent DNA methyltransferase [Cryobacterium zongtaii]|uniref:site-specific DNA-methyltransferase (adenine-specific) n=1 Tax=Cryobacterium zongtaii TaxID=1259217 RepID=A0A2S3ZNY0_9MICO|nr:class I SAM-dependent DNA methyltransferase [Cryobacterium zongtaii]